MSALTVNAEDATSPCYTLHHSAAFLASTTDDSLPPLIYVNNAESGIADNYSGSVSVFVLAMALGRRFYLQYDDLYGLGVVRPVFERWRWGGALPEPPDDRFLSNSAASKLALFTDGVIPAVVRSNRGMLTSVFNAGGQRADFLRQALGLTPETAFGCLHHALFRPTPALFPALGAHADEVAAAYRTLTADDDADPPTVVVQVRTSDATFAYSTAAEYPAEIAHDHRRRLDVFEACAERAVPGPKRLFLVTDSLVVRQAFAERGRGPGVEAVMATSRRVNHVSAIKDAGTSTESQVVAVAEHLLMSLADAWVVSEESGFGVTAAFRSMRAAGRVWLGETCTAMSVMELGVRNAGI